MSSHYAVIPTSRRASVRRFFLMSLHWRPLIYARLTCCHTGSSTEVVGSTPDRADVDINCTDSTICYIYATMLVPRLTKKFLWISIDQLRDHSKFVIQLPLASTEQSQWCKYPLCREVNSTSHPASRCKHSPWIRLWSPSTTKPHGNSKHKWMDQ